MTPVLLTERPTALLVPAPPEDATRREFITGVGAAALAAAFLAACGDGDAGATPEAATTREFVDALGRSVQVPARPERVVALNDSNGGAQVLSLGIPLTGLTTRNGVLDAMNVAMPGSDVLEDVTPLGEYREPDIEAIAALQPDLIVHYAWQGDDGLEMAFIDEAQLAGLEQIAPVVLMETFAPVAEVMERFGELLGVETEVQRQRVEFEERVATIREQMAVAPDALSVSHFYLWAADDFRVNRGDLSSMTQVIEAVLGTGTWSAPIYAEFPEPEIQIGGVSLERMTDVSADVVIHNHLDFDAPQSLRQLIDALPAARAGQLYEEPDPQEVPLARTYIGLGNALDFLEPILTNPDLRADLVE